MSDTGGPASEKTLLDEFAGQALAGDCAATGTDSRIFELRMAYAKVEGITLAQAFAREAYEQAAAMVAEKRRLESAQPPISTNLKTKKEITI